MAPNVILLDATYLDRVAAAFRQHFASELGREIPKADLAQWLVCLALDMGLEGPGAEVQCVLIHDREQKVMVHVAPGSFAQEIDAKAFEEPGFGEFSMACCPVERVTTLEDLCAESLEAILDDKKVKRVATVFDFDGTTPESRSLTKRIARICSKHAEACAKSADNSADNTSDADHPTQKDITLFTMQPLEGECFAQQLIGYSLMAALGIHGEEID